jgi:hypothetical protein
LQNDLQTRDATINLSDSEKPLSALNRTAPAHPAPFLAQAKGSDGDEPLPTKSSNPVTIGTV